jgi:hypothetical protein
MESHEELAAKAEAEADRLEERTDALGEQVEDAKQDWERKKADPAVPGAAGDPERAESGPEKGARYPTKD